MAEQEILLRLVLALGMGLLVGFQRESSFGPEGNFAGVRTFALTGFLGFACGHFSLVLDSPLPLCAGLLVSAALAVVTFLPGREGRAAGTTTEAAMVAVTAIGALCAFGLLRVAVAAGLLTTFLLSLKEQLHSMARRISREELVATVEFCVMCAVVLPVLPDRSFGPEPFNVFNPFRTWLLVVFISGIGFVGFVLTRHVGADKGIGFTGFLGGLVSSTALTLDFSRKARQAPYLARAYCFALLLAWAVMYVRLLGVIALLRPDLAANLAAPLLVSAAAGAAMAAAALRKARQGRGGDGGGAGVSNPFEILPALRFAALFLGILFVSRLAQVAFGEAGLCATSFFAGLANVDAMALSVIEILGASQGSVPVETAARACVIGAFANTLSKGAMVALLGGPAFRREMAPGVLVVAAAVGASLLLV